MARLLIIIFINFIAIVAFVEGLEIWSHTGGFHSFSGSSDHSTIDHGSFSGSDFSGPIVSDDDSTVTGRGLFGGLFGGGTRYQAPPIYGPTGYTYGTINRMFNVETGSNSGNYNGYSNNYWICVNSYRGQYYYSYTYGKYICDARANNSYNNNNQNNGQYSSSSYYPSNYNSNYYYQNYGK